MVMLALVVWVIGRPRGIAPTGWGRGGFVVWRRCVGGVRLLIEGREVSLDPGESLAKRAGFRRI